MQKLINELKETPIKPNPDFSIQDYLENKHYYHQQVICCLPVLKDNPWHKENLGYCADFGLLFRNYYFGAANLTAEKAIKQHLSRQVCLRTSILRDLQLIDEQLKSTGLRFLILSGYRHPDLQRYILREAARQKGAEFANKMLANPDFYAPHATGAALDLEIWDEKNKMVLPTKINGSIGRLGLEEKSSQTLAEQEVRANRRLIHNLLTTDCLLPKERVFVGHPFEYWHYGRHERLSAFFAGLTQPIYYDVVL